MLNMPQENNKCFAGKRSALFNNWAATEDANVEYKREYHVDWAGQQSGIPYTEVLTN